MKRGVLLVVFLFLLLQQDVRGQSHIYYGRVIDTVSFDFVINDSLYRTPERLTLETVVGNKATPRLWQLGTTTKSFFTDSCSIVRGLMTDTLHPYPVNANSWFSLSMPIFPFENPIIHFTHKYQTTPGKDGGIVEFSLDTGQTWQNVLGDCNVANSGFMGIITDSFYSKTDTLVSGDQAFSGSSNEWLTSYIQIFSGFPVRLTGNPPCNFFITIQLMLRFRFVSDSIPDSLDGWMFKDITIERDQYPGAVPEVNRIQHLNIYPNPVIDGILYFPALDNEGSYSIEIMNGMGQRTLVMPYQHEVDLSHISNGLYFYRVSNGEQSYGGKFVVE